MRYMASYAYACGALQTNDMIMSYNVGIYNIFDVSRWYRLIFHSLSEFLSLFLLHLIAQYFTECLTMCYCYSILFIGTQMIVSILVYTWTDDEWKGNGTGIKNSHTHTQTECTSIQNNLMRNYNSHTFVMNCLVCIHFHFQLLCCRFYSLSLWYFG